MTTTKDLSSLSTPRKIALAAAVVLLIDSFLPWYHISIGVIGSVNASGWHGVGVVAWLLTIVLLALEGSRIAGMLPLDDARAELATLAAAAGVVLFGLIYVIVRLSDGYLGFGFYIGLVALVVLAVGAFGMFRSGDAMGTLKNLQASPGSPGGDAGPTPPPSV